MVHIELILYTTYCIAFSITCFLVLKKLYNKKLEELEQLYQKGIDDLDFDLVRDKCGSDDYDFELIEDE